MDRYGRRTALILALAALAVPASATGPLTAQRWLMAGTDPAVLTRQPAECLAMPTTPQAALSVEIGRAAFRSPTLLGGQAARAGLSCESCHRNGRTNPDFHFPGISGEPGTADVTASLFSSHRGDDRFNPKPIPDLGGPKDRLKVPQDSGPALKDFIHGLIVEEFDGHEPPPRVLDGVAAYVRSLQACPAPPAHLSASEYASDAVRAADAARGALAQPDAPTALVMIAAVRARLGAIAERYASSDLAGVRNRLLEADAQLVVVRDDVRAGDLRKADGRLKRWIDRASAWRTPVLRSENRSLFDEKRLAAAGR